MARDNTGVKDTCPLINEIIAHIRCSYENESPFSYAEFVDAESVLEDIRQMNYELRQIANEYIEKEDDLQGEIKMLNVEISILQDDKKELEEEIKSLNKQISDLEFNVMELQEWAGL